MYGFNPRAPIDLLPLSTTEQVHSDAKECADFILKLLVVKVEGKLNLNRVI